MKDALNGSSPLGVLEAAEQGEDHAEKEYGRGIGLRHLAPICVSWCSVRAPR